MDNFDSGFCTQCGFKISSFEGLTKCPNCNSETLPCVDSEQVTISINWHELRCLCIWAEQWENAKCDGAGLIYSIAQRIQEQYPNKTPLTLASEVQGLPKNLGTKVITNIQGVEKNKDGEVI